MHFNYIFILLYFYYLFKSNAYLPNYQFQNNKYVRKNCDIKENFSTICDPNKILNDNEYQIISTFLKIFEKNVQNVKNLLNYL